MSTEARTALLLGLGWGFIAGILFTNAISAVFRRRTP